jgi:quercetin dioxygenase-like cupin family protein
MTKINGLTLSILAVTAGAACASAAPTPAPQTVSTPAGDTRSSDPSVERPVERPAQAFQFDTITPFLKFSDAYGDRATSAHGTFGMIPAQTASPSHTHSAAYHGVVIQGEMTDGFNGEANPPHLGPGSYWYVPGNAVHITACVSTVPCLFYTHADAKFDFAPATATGAGLPAGAIERPAAEFRFDTITPFLKFSDAWGDRTSGPHGTFGIIPGETASPSHIHNAAYHGVVIQGEMTDGFDGEANPPRLGPGSYWYVPARAVHITACVSKVPCLFYTHSDGKFDFALAQ